MRPPIEGEEPIRPPTITYKLAFLIGGAVFAVATYLLGTIIYQAEHQLSGAEGTDYRDIPAQIANIYEEHLFTFIPWVVGTTGLSIALGFLYDRQHAYRRQAEALAVTDSLTLLYNHRYLVQELAREISRAGRPMSGEFSILLLDVDDFKRYNDTYGHLAGDDVLRAIAIATRSSVRSSDMVARYGGEEFVLLAPGATKATVAPLAERIRQRIEADTPVTVSIGVASYPEDGQTADQLMKAADAAMYTAKTKGKNRIHLAPGPQAEHTTPGPTD